MRVLTITLLTIVNIVVQGQAIKRPVDLSTNKNFGLLIETTALPDVNTEWKYWLIINSKDTILLTTTITHDEFQPVTYWSKSSEEIIFEDRTNEATKIKVYNLNLNKIDFETPGFIWGLGKNNFDQDNGFLFYFKRTDNKGTFDLMTLNLKTKKVKKLSSVTTSGDPITGAPEIESIDKIKKQLTLRFETKDYKQEKIQVEY